MVRSLIDPPKRTPERELRAFGTAVGKPPATEWRPWHDLEALYLGEIIVGRVAPMGGGRAGTKPRACFDLAAIQHCGFWFDCNTIEDAKRQIEERLADWLRKAGLA